MAGIAFPSQLLIAKVVRANRQVSLEAEADAIRWAVDNGARVINLSLGGVRDPRDAGRDTYSPLEASAVRYAYTRGVVIVAAVGNADQAPRSPWPYASYPAALPHVIGVSALGKDGSVPLFSNRDPIYNDLAAPGQELISTFPRQLTALRASCPEQGYSICGSDDYRNAEGTSFAAPQVTAAAALLLAARPQLQPDQVGHILTRSAEDVSAATGCKQCPLQRDIYSGWGKLNIAKSLAGLAGPIPLADRFESNDDAGTQATPMRQTRVDFSATLDFWDDNVDVYKVYLRARQQIVVTLDGPRGVNTDLLLWKPGTQKRAGAVARAAPPACRALGEAGDARADRRTARRQRAGTTSRRRSCSPAPARTGSVTRSARAALRQARRAARAPGFRRRRRAAARPSSRPRRRRRTPPRRSRHPGRGSRRLRLALRGGSSGP